MFPWPVTIKLVPPYHGLELVVRRKHLFMHVRFFSLVHGRLLPWLPNGRRKAEDTSVLVFAIWGAFAVTVAVA